MDKRATKYACSTIQYFLELAKPSGDNIWRGRTNRKEACYDGKKPKNQGNSTEAKQVTCWFGGQANNEERARVPLTCAKHHASTIQGTLQPKHAHTSARNFGHGAMRQDFCKVHTPTNEVSKVQTLTVVRIPEHVVLQNSVRPKLASRCTH